MTPALLDLEAGVPKTSKNVFEVLKPMGLTLQDFKDGLGAKVVEIDPNGNAANVDGMEEEMRLLSVNGQPCKDAPFDDIMSFLRDLDSSMPIGLELEAAQAIEDSPDLQKVIGNVNPETGLREA